jgi:hypothetical protein
MLKPPLKGNKQRQKLKQEKIFLGLLGSWYFNYSKLK